MMIALGILIFFVGVLFSVALHELGHLSTAKMFGIKVTQYMVGFGKTVFSKKVGETEYGLKALPFGGYIRMIGMLPPKEGQKVGRLSSTGAFRAMIDDARTASAEDVSPADIDRQFYQRKPWKRIIVMLAGPGMNLILAVALFAVVLMGFGTLQGTTTVATVSKCVVPATQAKQDECPTNAPPSPAAAAGFKPGDKIVSFQGKPFTSWNDLQPVIRGSSGTVSVEIERDGQRQTLTPTLISTERPDLDNSRKQVQVGFLGLSPTSEMVKQDIAGVGAEIGNLIGRAWAAIIRLPERIPELISAIGGGERAMDSPMGIVGASRLGGDVLNLDIGVSDKIRIMLMLLAGLNLSLFLFNLLPLLPLDGGHVAAALWESLRRGIAKLLRRPDPGPFDAAKLMPLAYAMSVVILLYGGLVLVADIVNPVRLN